MTPLAIHWTAGLNWINKSGWKCQTLSGWAVCCSGDRAQAIRKRGNGTDDPSKVTCKKCLTALAQACQNPIEGLP